MEKQKEVVMPSLKVLSKDNSLHEKHERFLNRELSLLQFNARVLDEAYDENTPILEKLKFLSIFTSNQDEYFMVRVAGLKKLFKEGFSHTDSPDEASIQDILQQISKTTRYLIERQYWCLQQILIPSLEQRDVTIEKFAKLSVDQQMSLAAYFHQQVMPVLTPRAVDPSHPFPFLSNLALYLLAEFEPRGLTRHNSQPIAFVEIPSIIPRLVPIPDSKQGVHQYILLEDLVQNHLHQLFLGFKVKNCALIRVTRNNDYFVLENEVVDLLKTIERKIATRERQAAVRLEVQGQLSEAILSELMSVLRVDEADIYHMPEPLYIPGILSLCQLPFSDWKVADFNPRLPSCMAGNQSIFSLIKEKDLLVHHPYDSFYAVIEFLAAAAIDPHVFAIKQTLYRSSGDSPMIDVLIKAAEEGKHVTAVVELKARFDEKNNIEWARRLERAGVNVVYGFIGLKTHCKATLVIRKENQNMISYVHLSTGNYNSQTAKLYTDIGFFTARESLGKDIAALFNLLTGFNVLSTRGCVKGVESIPHFKEIAVAPIFLRDFIIAEIDRTIESQKNYGNSLIMAKVNGLADNKIIEKLYEASQAGVKIKLVVRGICCLRPGVAGLSANIEVISLIDRFLEHSRIYYFQEHDGNRVYLGSADWMTRNMDRRIEIMFPIHSAELKARLIIEILNTFWLDNCKARMLLPDGTYVCKELAEDEKPLRAQQRFIELARQDGIKSLPYDKAIHYIVKKKNERPVARRHVKKSGKI